MVTIATLIKFDPKYKIMTKMINKACELATILFPLAVELG